MSMADNATEARFKDLFPNAEEHVDNREKAVGMVNADNAVMLLYDDTEEYGVIDLSDLDTQPDRMQYVDGIKDDGEIISMWVVAKDDTRYHYQDKYVSKIAEMFGIPPASMGDHCYSDFDHNAWPSLFEKDGVRILISPFIVS